MTLRLTLMAATLLVAAACDDMTQQGQGFSLPDGSKDRGQEAFVRLGCNGCHVVDGVDQADNAEMSIKLGSEDRRSKTYGELVTAVINPSHRTSRAWLNPDVREQGEARMSSYNDVMTVQELVDIVTFLQSQYQVEPYSKTRYLEYYRKKQQEG